MRRSGGITLKSAHAESRSVVGPGVRCSPRNVTCTAVSPSLKGDAAVPPSAPPRTVRIAAALTIAEAVAGLAFAVALLVRTTASDLGAVNTLDRTDTFAEAGYFAILSLAVLAAGIGMWQGRHWARTHVVAKIGSGLAVV